MRITARRRSGRMQKELGSHRSGAAAASTEPKRLFVHIISKAGSGTAACFQPFHSPVTQGNYVTGETIHSPREGGDRYGKPIVPSLLATFGIYCTLCFDCLTFRPQAFRPQLFRPQIFEAGMVQRYTHSGPNITGPSKLVPREIRIPGFEIRTLNSYGKG